MDLSQIPPVSRQNNSLSGDKIPLSRTNSEVDRLADEALSLISAILDKVEDTPDVRGLSSDALVEQGERVYSEISTRLDDIVGGQPQGTVALAGEGTALPTTPVSSVPPQPDTSDTSDASDASDASVQAEPKSGVKMSSFMSNMHDFYELKAGWKEGYSEFFKRAVITIGTIATGILPAIALIWLFNTALDHTRNIVKKS